MKRIVYLFIITFLIWSCKKEEALTPTETGPFVNTTPVNGNAGGGSGGGSVNSSYQWTRISDFPGLARDAGVGFSINGKGYVGLGTEYPDFFKDFYAYTPATDTWTKLADFPGEARRGALAFVLGNFAYVGFGYGSQGSGFGWHEDFWKYDPANDSWTQLADDPNVASEGASVTIYDGKAYMLEGESSNWYEFDPTTEIWTEKTPSFMGDSRESAVAFTLGDNVYIGTGYDDGASGFDRLKDFHTFNFISNEWTQLSDFPAVGRNQAIAFVINGKAILGGGSDFFTALEDFYVYNKGLDTWTQIASYPNGQVSGQVSFVIGNTAYVGTGYESDAGPLGAQTKNFFTLKIP